MLIQKQLHKLPRATKQRRFNVSKEVAVNNTSFNVLVAWEEMMVKQANEQQDFILRTHMHEVETFSALVSWPAVKQLLDKIMDKFFAEMQGVYAEDEQLQIRQEVSEMTEDKMRNYVVEAEATVILKKEKKEKLDEKRRDGEARLENMTNMEIIFAGLLEAQKIFENRLSEDQKKDAINKAPPKAIEVPASMVLGKLAQSNPDMAKRYNIKVVFKAITNWKARDTAKRSSSGRSRSLSRQSRSSSKHSSRSRSGSFRSAHSKSPSRSSRSVKSSRSSSRSRSQNIKAVEIRTHKSIKKSNQNSTVCLVKGA